jgi:hypothetical protein
MKDTANRIIQAVDARVPNGIEEADKGRQLEETEKYLFDTYFSRFEGAQEIQPFEYQAGMDLSAAEMAVPVPYSRLYEFALEMLIHQVNGDLDHYNNARILYEDAKSDFGKYWTRTHRPLPEPRFRL